MSTHPCRRLLIVALLAPALAAQRAGAPELTLQPGSSLWVEGTSTMRSYLCSAFVMEGSVAAERAGRLADLAGGVGRVDVSVSVAAIDCRNQTMNSHMRNALEVERHPVIRFVAPSVAVASRGAEGTARVTGTLTIAGTERPLTLVAAVAEEANGGFRVRGSTRRMRWSAPPWRECGGSSRNGSRVPSPSKGGRAWESRHGRSTSRRPSGRPT